jgi:hypothetical protein
MNVPPAVDPGTRQGRLDLFAELKREGIFYKVDKSGTMPRAWVTPEFMQLPYDNKQAFVSIVAAYYGESFAAVHDSTTGKEVGYYTRFDGLEMK